MKQFTEETLALYSDLELIVLLKALSEYPGDKSYHTQVKDEINKRARAKGC